MIEHFVVAALLVFSTVAVHACFTSLVVSWLRRPEAKRWTHAGWVRRTIVLAFLILGLTVAAVFESGIWAAHYTFVGALPDFDQALYFSLVTYTTLGYGDVTLMGEWRLLAAFQSANGIIIFGWTTAIIVSVLQRITSERGAGHSSG